MKSTLMRLVVVASLGMVVAACTGLQQFPKVSKDYAADLKKIDPDYEKALAKINAKNVSENEKERIRNEEIDRRLRVIDLNFSEFRRGLAKEGVAADFGVALVQLGLGGAGSLVSETVSQILSATSAGLAGAQQAYSKAALYEKTVSALLAQMIASRKAVLVNIFTGRTKGIDDYPLSAAVLDLEAYEYAGSLPGAVIGTSADATVKKKAAEDKLAKFRETKFGEDESAIKIQAFLRPPDGKPSNPINRENAGKLRQWMSNTEFRDLPIAVFLSSAELKEMRERAIREIPIP